MKQICDLVFFNENDYIKKIEFAKELGFNGLIFCIRFGEKEIKEYCSLIEKIENEQNFFCYPAIIFNDFRVVRKFLNAKGFLVIFECKGKRAVEKISKKFGIDIVLTDFLSVGTAKFFRDNEIFYGLNINSLISLQNLKDLFFHLKLVKKFKVNLAAFSFANSYKEMRDWYCIANFLTLFDLEIKEAKLALCNYEKLFFRRSEKFIARGIELV
ncbi:MAG: hypothetical protein RMJ17_02625 [Candidatus Aenigmarchaeota archaeon]|nr:hypothetical protein [Candidatus Aenigmarchaeota archaeon]MDW8149464.1 hypothetical protein [Candidatus Aenigmarchaeota archaeon]